ncbi:MAG: hypothetical protein FJW30_10680 [Acidobacteria bacterium]|nr:hypothetical protein [Acidobacteriota bacterium]
MKSYQVVAAIALLLLTACPKPPVEALDQGWSEEVKWKFCYTPQGSQVLPYTWFLALEQENSTTLFRDNAHMEQLGYLPQGSWQNYNPDKLPIGFTKEREKAGQWEVMGLTCAACHTSRIEVNGKIVQLEGAPARADFQTMVTRLSASVTNTARDADKFKRFAAKVVPDGNAAGVAGLKKDLAMWDQRLRDRVKNNLPPLPPGYARVDALGNIANQTTAVDLGIMANLRPPDAPVSYPAIWDAHRQDFVQWNGTAPNVGPGPMLRNIGEVLGVFGSLAFSPSPKLPPIYRASTVDVENLRKLEDWIAMLRSPAWANPEYGLPALDQAKVAAGKILFMTNCVGCHKETNRSNLNEPILVTMKEVSIVGTDGKLGEFIGRKAKTGPLEGTLIPPGRFKAEEPVAMVLRNAVIGVMVGNLTKALPTLKLRGPAQLFEDFQNAVKEKGAHESFFGKNPPQLSTPMYKARPHNGIWATAPYLHNGSVPDLWSMLQTPDQRPKKFYVGSRKFDSAKVGFDSSDASFFEFDTSLPGNSNQGHLFGTALSETEKWNLIEYLKSL